MKSNIDMTNAVVKSGKFSYARQSRKLAAYGTEYVIPVRTVEFAEKLDQSAKTIGSLTTTSDTISAVCECIALFIGAEETEKIFPKAKLKELDVDEVLAFWQALNYELQRSQNELLAKYRPAQSVRMPR